MHARPMAISTFLFAAAFLAGAQAFGQGPGPQPMYCDSADGSVPEPWSGWWWPQFDYAGGGPYVWPGGMYGGNPGPCYDFATKYLWLPQPQRDSAQQWEHYVHRTTDLGQQWAGHCAGVSCAQVMHPSAPDPTIMNYGALSVVDLKGLLGETYMNSAGRVQYSRRPIPPWGYVVPSAGTLKSRCNRTCCACC